MAGSSSKMSFKMLQEKCTDSLMKSLHGIDWVCEPTEGVKCFQCSYVLKHPIQLSCGHR